MPTIQIDSLTKRFGRTLAVDDLSFEVAPGTVTGFVGPNGAGKTTTLRMLLGLVVPTSGEATFDGRAYRDLDRPLEKVGAALESPGFHPGRTARNHMRVLCAAGGFPTERGDEVLTMVGLADAARQRVGRYSFGMRKRLALAGALLGDPEVLVLDEPAHGLDPHGARWLRDFLRWRAGQGGSVLLSSHVLAEVAQTVDRVVVIAGGRLVAHTTLAEVAAGAKTHVRVRTPQAQRLAELLRERGRALDGEESGRLVVHDANAKEIGELCVEHGIVLHELSPIETALEDVFFELTGTSPEQP